MKGRILIPALLAGSMALGACDQEGPTSVGADLVAPGFETFEFELTADRFLIGDTAVRGLFGPPHADEAVLARAFAGQFDAHTLFRFGLPPLNAAWEDDEGQTVLVEDPDWVAGELRLFVRSARSARDGDVEVRVQPLAEDWDLASATWELRVDTAGVQEAWEQPGGTVEGVGGSAILELEADTVIVPLDSATVAHWLDEDGARRGARLSVDVAGTRLFIHGAELVLKARVDEEEDEDSERFAEGEVTIQARTFIAQPAQPPPGQDELRVGGLPNWRTILQFRERLDTLEIPAELLGGRSARLGELQINKATLLLSPLPAAAGFVPEDTIRLEARAALLTAGVPVARAPLGDRLNPVRPGAGPDLFTNPSGDAVGMVLTELAIVLAEPPRDEDPARFTTIAIVAAPEQGTVGFASFGAMEAAERAPRLRLVVTRAEGGGLR